MDYVVRWYHPSYKPLCDIVHDGPGYRIEIVDASFLPVFPANVEERNLYPRTVRAYGVGKMNRGFRAN